MLKRSDYIALAFVLTIGALCIAAITATPSFVQTPKLMVAVIPTNGVTPIALGPTPGADGTKVTGLFVTNTSATPASYTVQIDLTRASATPAVVNVVMTTTTIAAGSGTTAAASPVNLLSPSVWPGLPTDSDGNPYFLLQSGDNLLANVTVAPTPGAVTVYAVAGNF